MRKIELERLILDKSGLKLLAARSAEIKVRAGAHLDVVDEPESRVGRSPAPLGARRPSHEERLANNGDIRSRAGWVRDIAGLLDGESGDARKELTTAIERQKRGESPAAPLYLEDAINRVLSGWPREEADEALVATAIASLSTSERPPRTRGVRR